MSRTTLYTPLPDDILDNPKVEDLLEEKGIACFGIWWGMQTLFRRYEEEGFTIPAEKWKKCAKKLHISEKKLKENLDYLVQKGFFLTETMDDGTVYLISPTRTLDLLDWQELREKQKKSAEKTNSFRWGEGKGRSTESV